jgi:hypothetical protein
MGELLQGDNEQMTSVKNTIQEEVMKNMGLVIGALLLCALLAMSVHAQELIIYPAKGQSAKQMEKDKANCQAWAKKETGVDPLALAEKSAAQPAPAGPKGERLKGAAKGAVAGAAVGAIAGDAGKGAAIGAGAGTVAGGARQRGKAKAEQQAQQQLQAESKASLDKFKRAYSACLEGKGYTIK